jgi:hypothetical protein
MHKARRAFENRQELRDKRASGGESGSALSNHVREVAGSNARSVQALKSCAVVRRFVK